MVKYIYKKHLLKSIYTYTTNNVQVATSDSSGKFLDTVWSLHSNMTFNEETGKFIVSGEMFFISPQYLYENNSSYNDYFFYYIANDYTQIDKLRSGGFQSGWKYRSVTRYKSSFSHSAKGELIEEVIAEEGLFPNDGIHTDNYWYTKDRLANSSPTLTIKDALNQSITSNQIIKHTNKTPFLFRILANDSDEIDTLEYSIWLRNSEYQTWTSISKGVENEISIPFDSLLMGNNTLQVKVRDSNGSETSLTFVLANINPESFSQQHVYELIVALGYAPTGNSSLAALKYPEYNKSTLSLAELVNFLQ